MLFAVGTYTTQGGPGLALISAQGQKMELLCAADALADPIWALTGKQGKTLYAACNQAGNEGWVASFSWSRTGLTMLSAQPTGGRACCHLCLDAEERYLYAANYLDGSVSVFPLAGEKILPRCQFVPHEAPLGPHPTRQECSHAHQVSFRPGTRELFVCNLGTDQVLIYDCGEDGKLLLRQAIACKPGAGARHLIFDGPARFYLVGELDGWVMTYALKNGAWECLQALPTIPEDFKGVNTAAAVRMTETHVYVSNRGHDSIACFDRRADGTLAGPRLLSVPGSFPRDFLLYEGGFLLAQQKSGGVAFLGRDGAAGPALDIPGAVCLCPLPGEA